MVFSPLYLYTMHISWLGQTAIKLQTKYLDEDVTVVIDAYKPDTGEFPRSLTPTLALFSKGTDDAITLSGDPFIMSSLGECELKEVMVTAFPSENGNIIFKLNSEQMNIVHLGRLNKKPELAELEKIGSIDILIVPVGGAPNYLSDEDAANLVTALEPRIVIPVGFQCDSDPKAKPVTDFIKELGLKPEITDKKVIVKKKDLPQEDMKLYLLEKNI